MQTTQTSENGVELPNVPKVEYGEAGVTPFPLCVQACARYLGKPLPYDAAMSASGAAFRLTWDETSWNGGNVDVAHTFDDPEQVYRLGLAAAGFGYHALWRGESTARQQAVSFLRAELDQGRPCIALGVIGPPEACIVTGYRDGGDTLLGWNFFQDNPEFAGQLQTTPSGYFLAAQWWDNPDTLAFFALDRPIDKPMTDRDVLTNALEALHGRRHGPFAKGLLAYDAWKTAMLDESQFPAGAVLPLLFERLMCQVDAMDCVTDGRYNAAAFLRAMADRHPEQRTLCQLAAKQLTEAADCTAKMYGILGGYECGEQQMRQIARREIREQLALWISAAKAADEQAYASLRALRDVL